MRSSRLTILVSVLVVGFASSSFAQVASAPFNVRTYGATGNGTTDDTTAVYAAMTAVPASGGEVYFPAGTYRLTQTLNVTTKPIAFRGEGQLLSILRFEGTYVNDGIYFKSSASPNNTLAVRSLSILRTLGGGMTTTRAAIYGEWLVTGTVGHMEHGGTTVTIDDVHIGFSPVGATNAWWAYGIFLTNSIAAKVDQITVRAPGASFGEAAVYVTGHSLGTRISDCDVSDIKRGVWQNGSSEGLSISSCDIGGVEYGAVIEGGTGNAVADSHFNAQKRGIQLTRAYGMAVTSNLIFQGHDAPDGYIGIELLGPMRFARLVGNAILPVVGTTGARFGITLAGDIADTIIQGNQTDAFDVGIYIVNSAVARSLVTGNSNRNTASPIINLGTNTHLANNCPTTSLCL